MRRAVRLASASRFFSERSLLSLEIVVPLIGGADLSPAWIFQEIIFPIQKPGVLALKKQFMT